MAVLPIRLFFARCRCGNVASILAFDDKLGRETKFFTETAENTTMMAPRTPARYFW